MLTKIHNNPKLKGPRMPVLLDEAWTEQWLQPSNEETDKPLFKELIQPFPEDVLEAHTVGKLRGRDYPGNVPEVSDPVHYEALEF